MLLHEFSKPLFLNKFKSRVTSLPTIVGKKSTDMIKSFKQSFINTTKQHFGNAKAAVESNTKDLLKRAAISAAGIGTAIGTAYLFSRRH